LTRDAPPATIVDFVSGARLGNAFEPVLRRLEPEVDAALRVMSEFGQASLTGSGSGCFLRFETQQAALQARAKLPGGWSSWVAAGVSRSPLMAALEVGGTPD
jgi:4-diphosphocytidyl-2-C-methyl-D-erythritol kinase